MSLLSPMPPVIRGLRRRQPSPSPGTLRLAACVLHLLAITGLCLAVPGTAGASTHFVTPTGAGDHSGSDWSNSMATISAALLVAEEGDQIWVAAGRYEEHIHNRVVGEVPINVELYGGFAGSESSLGERDVEENPTTIDGTASGIVITISDNARPSTRIDGFRITGGSGADGGGLRIVTAAPVIANNTIYLNQTNGIGAGIHVSAYNSFGEHPLISNNTIVENYALELGGEGGGIGLVDSNARIIDNVIARNKANLSGGGIAVHENSSPQILRNFILANTANALDPGTGIVYDPTVNSCWIGGGGIFVTAFSALGCDYVGATSAPLIANNVIAANGAFEGGGLAVLSTPGTATLVNNTIVANSGAGVYWSEANLHLQNNLVAYNSFGFLQDEIGTTGAVLSSNNVFGNHLQHRATDFVGLDDPTGTSGNLSADPLMANYEIGDFHIQPQSPCVDAGDAVNLPAGGDVENDLRLIGDTVDIGADESDGTLWNSLPTVVRVAPGGDDEDDGSTWLEAKATVQDAVDEAALHGGEVWVAQGTYTKAAGGEPLSIPPFVRVLGGFNGTEGARIERDWSTNETILDGNGEPPVARFTTGGYLVSSLDGFTVQNGGVFKDGDVFADTWNLRNGGGLEILVSGPEIANNVVQRNSVGNVNTGTSRGGGILGYVSTAVIHDNTVRHNEVWSLGGSGGGMFFHLSNPMIEDNIISENYAISGAGVDVYGIWMEPFFTTPSTPLIRGNLISANTMYTTAKTAPQDGAVRCTYCDNFALERNVLRDNVSMFGAGLTLFNSRTARIESNLFLENSATGNLGGGAYVVVAPTPLGDIRIINNTFLGNSGSMGAGIAISGGDILDPPDDVVVANNVIANNSSGIWMPPTSYVGIRVLDCNDLYNNGGFDYINVAPSLTDLALDPQLADGDGRPGPTSPCLDGGSPVEIPTSDLDLDGTPRFQDADWDGDVLVDIGAYEYRTAYGIAVSPTSGLETSEAGDSAQFSIELYSAPADEVSIDISSSDPGEGFVSPTTLTFSSTSWSTPQSVTVTGVDDDIEDSGQAFTVLTHPSTSADPTYSDLDAADVSVVNRDDLDCGGFDVVVVDSRIFPAGATILCTAFTELATTGDVVVPAGAFVTFTAPLIDLDNGFMVASDGTFRAP